MICAKPDVNGFLQLIPFNSPSECQYLLLVEQSQLDSPLTVLDAETVLAIWGVCSGLYALVYVFKLVAQQLGYFQG